MKKEFVCFRCLVRCSRVHNIAALLFVDVLVELKNCIRQQRPNNTLIQKQGALSNPGGKLNSDNIAVNPQ